MKAILAIIGLPILGIMPDFFVTLNKKMFNPDAAEAILRIQKSRAIAQEK